MIVERSSGVLLHPTSLPGRYGIGDMGKEAYEFIDFLEGAKQKLWQVLPLGHTGFGDSPYQCFSAYAGNPILISPDKLYEIDLLSEEDLKDIPAFDPIAVEYGEVIVYKYDLLKKAYSKFISNNDEKIQEKYNDFVAKNSAWLNDYALFMALKDYHGGASWYTWEKDIANREVKAIEAWSEKLAVEAGFYKFVQFIFDMQWSELKEYANSKGVKIVGDIPMFVAYDGSEVWSNRELFELDDAGNPKGVAGVPPDAFSADGQLWGNPLYDWKKMKETGYAWWISVLSSMLDKVDIIRIDHFRGFHEYWRIPYGDKTATGGKWVEGPADSLFEAVEKALGKLPIIAEDLGFITPGVLELRDKFDFPGMNILMYGFGDDGAENTFLPHHHSANSVVYTGTHDNDTMWAAYQDYSEEVKDYVKKYVNTTNDGPEIVWDIIRIAYASTAVMAVIPLQDLMCLGSEARMNTPGTSAGNWRWRFKKEMITEEISEKLIELTTVYGR
ncbi:MAG: 4-alpha-glucanotransferase [Bacillota bacterium]|nr:4-alpha-glucanotransferase [Bacillota bacterium]